MYCRTVKQQPRDAGEDLPKLLEFAERLSEDVASMQRSVPLDSDSPEFSLCFMAACFVSREVDHLRGVASLARLGLDSEALILARSMLEGMVQLLWAAQSPEERPSTWHKYVFVEDWRVTQRWVPPFSQQEEDDRALLEERVRLEAGGFLTRKARRARDAGGELPPDPYQPRWHGGNTIKDLFEQTSADELWPLYRSASESVHWTMRGLGSSVVRNDTKLTYQSEDSNKAATALASGIQAVLQISQILSGCLGEDASQSIASLYGEYVKFMGAA